MSRGISGGQASHKIGQCELSLFLFGGRTSMIATAFKKVTIIHPPFAIVLLKI